MFVASHIERKREREIEINSGKDKQKIGDSALSEFFANRRFDNARILWFCRFTIRADMRVQRVGEFQVRNVERQFYVFI